MNVLALALTLLFAAWVSEKLAAELGLTRKAQLAPVRRNPVARRPRRG